MNKNKSQVGNIFKTKDGNYVVLEEYLEGNYRKCLIEFLETKSKRIIFKSNIGRTVTDFYKNKICGVGHLGKEIITKDVFYKKTYKRWYSMLERCYKKTSHMYSSYGGKGVKVSDSWLCFSNYFEEIKKIKGFDLELYINGKIQLDKDIKKENNKMYSFENCIFVETKTNKSFQPSKRKKFAAVNPDGEIFIYSNQSECAKINNLTARTIGKVLYGKLKTHKNWKFYYL